MPKYKSESPVYRAKEKIYLVNCDKRKPIFTHQMGKIVDQLENMLTWHADIFVYVFNLHVKTFTVDNKYMTKLMRKLRFHFKQNYKSMKRLGYAWCREQHRSNTQHYHVGLILDRAKIKSPTKLFTDLQMIWEEIAPGGHVHGLENCYYEINRKTRLNMPEAVFRLSYLAKVWTKGKNPIQANDYGTSRIKQGPR